MVFRSSAAICGAAITLAVSVVMARSEIDRGHSNAVAKAASGAAIVGAASMYNPYRPGWQEGGPNTASGERYDPSIPLRGRQLSKLVYAGNLAESDMARARSMPSLRPRAKRPLSK